jgi:hypothetical protein
MDRSSVVEAIHAALDNKALPHDAPTHEPPKPARKPVKKSSAPVVSPNGANSVPPTKKGPGRPKKVPVMQLGDAEEGVQDTPKHQDNIVELIYSQPLLFKKLKQLFKSFDVEAIEFSFEHDGLYIQAQDHLQHSRICVVVKGEMMSRYYCKKPYQITVPTLDLSHALDALTKTHTKIMLYIRAGVGSLYLVFHDSEYNTEDVYELMAASSSGDTIQRSSIDDSEYTVAFKVTSKHFKTMLNNICKIATQFQIVCTRNGELQIKLADSSFAQVKWRRQYHTPGLISLRNNVPIGNTFLSMMTIEYVKPLATSNIGEDVVISADVSGKVCFTTELDKKAQGYAATIKVFMESMTVPDV